jgi:hypothetical protein
MHVDTIVISKNWNFSNISLEIGEKLTFKHNFKRWELEINFIKFVSK